MAISNIHKGWVGSVFGRKATGVIWSLLYRSLLIFLVWTAIGVFLSLPVMLNKFTWPEVFAKIIEAWAWALVTPIMLFISHRVSGFDAKPYRQAGLLLLLSIPIVVIHTYLTAFLQLPIPGIWFNPLRLHSTQFYVYYFLNGWLTYCAVMGAMMTFDYYKNYLAGRMELERVEKRLIQSHLNMLRMQLEPHFLFNALNAISSVVVSDPELAREMIEDLGALLRLSLDYKDNQEIPLAQEIVLLEHYLAIQRVRFGERIKTEISVSPLVANVPVPCMLLQPIVENAIRHGLGNRLSGGTVKVSADRIGDYVEFRVQDDGVGLPANWQGRPNKGLGLRVSRERLAGLYPQFPNSFEIGRRSPSGTEVIMRVPIGAVQAGTHGTANQ